VSAFDFPSRVDVVIVDSIGDPAFVVDTHGVVMSCNQEAAWLVGRPVRQVIGRTCFSVVRACLPSGELACSANCPLIQGLGVLPGPPAVELVVRGRGVPATRHAINVQHIPLSDSHGSPSGLLHIMTLAGPADEDVQNAAMSMGASYLG
jgi:PAS domain-containing protein